MTVMTDAMARASTRRPDHLGVRAVRHSGRADLPPPAAPGLPAPAGLAALELPATPGPEFPEPAVSELSATPAPELSVAVVVSGLVGGGLWGSGIGGPGFSGLLRWRGGRGRAHLA